MKSPLISTDVPAPPFSLPAVAGGTVSLAAVASPAVLLVFYRGSWCPACRWQLGHLRDRYDEFTDRDAAIVAISADPTTSGEEAKFTASLPFPVLSDVEAAVISSFGVGQFDEERGRTISRPATFVLDRDRLVRFAFVGEHPRDRPTVGSLVLAIDQIAT